MRVTTGFSFPQGNAKIAKETLTFSLPAGHSCPFAKECLTKADKKSGCLKDGPDQKFRCFSASAEAAFPSVRDARWENWRLVKAGLRAGTLAEKLATAIKPKTEFVRIHVGGDFFSQAYFDAWMKTAKIRSEVVFYAYTKSIPYWLERRSQMPVNMRLTASLGGTHDALAIKHKLPTAEVVFHPKDTRLEIDHDDSLASSPIRANFALLLHGCQKRNSMAAAALQTLRNSKIPFGYPKRLAA